MLVPPMKPLISLVALLALSACYSGINDGHYYFPVPQLLSDAHILFDVRNQHITISDSSGGEAMPGTMGAQYDRSDSIMRISGRTGGVDIYFTFKGLLSPAKITLDQPYRFSDSLQISPQVGSAALRFYSDPWTLEGDWRTDSIHTGVLEITSFDSVDCLISATFRFSGFDTTKRSSLTDTVLVGNGVISRMHFYYN